MVNATKANPAKAEDAKPRGYRTPDRIAVVPGASVEVLRAGTAIDDTVSANVVATTSTDDTGAFTAAFLPPGEYALRVTPPAAAER